MLDYNCPPLQQSMQKTIKPIIYYLVLKIGKKENLIFSEILDLLEYCNQHYYNIFYIQFENEL